MSYKKSNLIGIFLLFAVYSLKASDHRPGSAQWCRDQTKALQDFINRRSDYRPVDCNTRPSRKRSSFFRIAQIFAPFSEKEEYVPYPPAAPNPTSTTTAHQERPSRSPLLRRVSSFKIEQVIAPYKAKTTPAPYHSFTADTIAALSLRDSLLRLPSSRRTSLLKITPIIHE